MRRIACWFLVLLFLLPAASQAASGDIAVVLHGIFRTSSHMKPLADYLEKQGYEVLNLDYPSTDYPLETLIEMTAKNIDSRIADKSRTVHFVGYSMGGLVTRGVLARHRPEHLGRVVMLGTPNHGSEVADFLKDNALYKRFYGPAGQQLVTADFQPQPPFLGAVDYELGIIAGNFTIDPFTSYIIPGDDDGDVAIESTKLEGMKEHIVLSVSHLFFPDNKQVHKKVAAFLKNGTFN